ncbi:MAG TPA: hypothetical protein VHZ29_13455 [Rhizomicrobium sp.]|jgi:hypothetical protein|nr:hypothetical protein [Rhizomicrobium sp.]
MSCLRVLPLVALAACVLAVPASAAPGPFTYRAVVGKFGALGRHGAGVVSSEMIGKGHYLVDFAAAVDTCAVVGTLGRATEAGGSYEKPGYISATVADGGSSSVVVRTADMRGRPRDYAFHLLVACP